MPGASTRLLVLSALALAGLAGCSTSRRPLPLTPPSRVRAEDYEEVLARWTRKDEIYDSLDSKLFAFATFHSPEFRRVFALRHTDIYGPGSEEAQRLLLIAPETEESLDFFLSASTASPLWNDFDRPTSIWRVTIEGDDGERVDGKVSRLKTTANLRVIYPYITDFARTYTVRFPRMAPSGRPIIGPATKSFTLRIASALGQAEMTWALKPDGELPPDVLVQPLPELEPPEGS